MKELSLFTGCGGGILGSKLLGWKTIGYVEWESYCQKVIAQRITDGIFDKAPIFGDIRAFNSEGYAEQYQGMVDIITGGFPCQPFSFAGKRRGADDPRNMWPETARCIRTIRPRFVFLENVPGLLRSGYFGKVLSDLYEMGYDVRWCVLSAADVGAVHKRDRLWIFAYSKCWRREAGCIKSLQPEKPLSIKPESDNLRCALPDTNKLNDDNAGHGTGKISQQQETAILNISNTTIKRLSNRPKKKTFKKRLSKKPERHSWWATEPGICRVVNGMANRSHRLKAIGNGQVPLTMAAAFQILSEGII